MASSPAAFTAQITALWVMRTPVTARRIGILPCKDEPQTPLPRPAMPVARYETSAEWTTQNQSAKTATILIRRTILAPDAPPCPSWTRPQDDHHAARESHRTVVPAPPGTA